MGSAGESDRKRRQFSSISLTAAAAKKPSLFTEDKKLDATVLQYQNQKLVQKLEVQKAERLALENKLCQLNERQQPYGASLVVVNKSWKVLVGDLESCSHPTMNPDNCRQYDSTSSMMRDQFLSRLIEMGATQSGPNEMQEDEDTFQSIRNILCKLMGTLNDLWHLKDRLHDFVSRDLYEGSSRQKTSCDLVTEIENLRLVLLELHLKHKSLSGEMQNHRDGDAKNKAALQRLRGELESSVAELGESNCKLVTLKAEMDESRGGVFSFMNLNSKHTPADRNRDKQKDSHDTDSALEELLDQASFQLVELKGLHEERIGILKNISTLQNTIKSFICVYTSQAFLLVQDQLARSKEEVAHHQALLEKLQVEKDDLSWREKDINVKNDLVEAFQRLSAAADVRINELETEEQKQLDLRNLIEANKQKAASDEPRRKEIIAEFRELVSSFPGSMGAMQDKIRSFKEAAADVHALRADLHSLSKILDRKAKEFDDLSVRSAEHVAEIAKLQAIVEYLKQSEFELKLIFEMFQRESTDSRDITEARDLEIKAWAHAQNLVASLDEHSLELRVKTANEAEARSQQKLAVAEAVIADLRQKLEACKRNSVRLTDALKSKHEENDAYLSEIETIGQAYDDMQNQNQQLLQQITERDDYNIKLCLESVRDRQLQEVLLVEKLSMEKAIQQTNSLLDFFDIKAARIEDQLKACEDHIQKLAEERMQNSDTLENAEKKILDVRKPSGQYWELLEGLQLQVGKNRVNGAELRIELEKERFEKKRIEEELEVSRKKVWRLRAQRDGSSVVGKLNRELKEYREILKCGICFDRPKEVVITKCYHLFCSSCVQKILGTRHRKCPMCSSSFGHNDVKSVYI